MTLLKCFYIKFLVRVYWSIPPRDPVTGEKDYETMQEMLGGRYKSHDSSSTNSEQSAASIELSPSMSKVASKLSGFTTVNALSIVMKIMEVHNEYVGGKAAKFVKQVDPSNGITRPFEDWLREVRLLFRPEKQQILHGRLVMLGLAMISQSVRSELMGENFLRELVVEYERDVSPQMTEESSNQGKIMEYVLTDIGVERWKTIFLPTIFDPVPTHTDNPSYVDLLGRRPFAKALAIRLQDYQSKERKKGSFLVHLFGPWGSGKSTFLNFLKKELESPFGNDKNRSTNEQKNRKTRKWLIVEFNAWQHQRVTPPWWSLMDAVYKTSLENVSPLHGLKIRLRENAWRLWHGWSRTFWIATLFFAAIGVGLLSGAIDMKSASDATQSSAGLLTFIDSQVVGGFMALIISILTGIRAFGNSLLPGSPNVASEFVKKTSDPMEKLKSHFEDMIHQIEEYPVAIFVDDLDRCHEGYTVEFLEGVQTIFRNAGIVFVISADRQWLYASYQKAYNSFSETLDEMGRPLGYLFLDKIFQISVSLPRLSQIYQEKYLDYLITMDETKAQKMEEVALHEAETEVQNMPYSEMVTRLQSWSGDPVKERAFREAVVTRLAQPESDKITENFLKKFAAVIEPNPRSMKRLVTAYGLWRAKDILARTNIEENMLAQWVIITLRWPLVALFLENNPEVADILIAEGEDETKNSAEKQTDERIRPLRINRTIKPLSTILLERGITADIQKMLLDPVVNAVLLGQQTGKPLDSKTIRTLVSL